jgi:hypothetical protein
MLFMLRCCRDQAVGVCQVPGDFEHYSSIGLFIHLPIRKYKKQEAENNQKHYVKKPRVSALQGAIQCYFSFSAMLSTR